MNESGRYYVNYAPYNWGIGAGVAVLVGAVICFILAGTSEIEIATSLYTGEGILMLLAGIIIVCFFITKKNETNLNEQIYVQNLKMVNLLETQNEKIIVTEKTDVSNNDELPFL